MSELRGVVGRGGVSGGARDTSDLGCSRGEGGAQGVK